jgi:hypothetical protein
MGWFRITAHITLSRNRFYNTFYRSNSCKGNTFSEFSDRIPDGSSQPEPVPVEEELPAEQCKTRIAKVTESHLDQKKEPPSSAGISSFRAEQTEDQGLHPRWSKDGLESRSRLAARSCKALEEMREERADLDLKDAAAGKPEEENLEVLFELDRDPLVEPGFGPTREWLEQLEQIKPRELVAPKPEAQTEAIRQILETIDNDPAEPSSQLVEETERAVDHLADQIPNAEEFVAGGFQAFSPAWTELLRRSKRASSRQVLRWLEHGFVPKLVGSEDAPRKNKEAVKVMLRRVMTAAKVEEFLSQKYPGRVEFKNHQSFYNHGPFASKEVINLFKVRAATLLPRNADRPVIVHPFGVALTAGKERLICDARALNIFLKNLPFQYEKLGDVLAYTKEGFFMVSWDLKSDYYHVPIHPAYRKFFGFKIGDRYGVYNVIYFGLSKHATLSQK